MKLELKITQHDKKLLYFLAIFVIVVGFGFLVIRPLVVANLEVSKKLSVAQEQKSDLEQKVGLSTSSKKVYDTLLKDLEKSVANFYPMMKSEEIDKMITDLLLDYGVFSRDLDIQVGTDEVELKPYGKDVTEDKEEISTGIYAASVSVTATGKRNTLQQVIDTLARDYPSIRITAYNWSSELQTVNSDNTTGELKLDKTSVLTLNLEVYMYDEDTGE